MTCTVAQALTDGAARLAPVAGDQARREASILLAHLLGSSAGSLATQPDRALTDQQAAALDLLLAARERHQPIAQIIGRRAFWEHDFIVTPDVLDPRPDTELLVELAVAQRDARRVLDLGTGSGCILCSVLHSLPRATGLGVDMSEAALAVARRNAQALGVAERAEFLNSSFFEAATGRFDLILCNPPYVTQEEFDNLDPDVQQWEPKSALTDDADGLVAYRVIAAQLADYLAPGGLALFEHGWRQAAAVRAIFRAQGFGDVRSHRDLAGKERVVAVA